MKAAVCQEFGTPLVIEDLTIAEPNQGEVKVRIKAVAICHSDILYAAGAWGGDLPAVYGHEAAGIAQAVGPGVKGIEPGDHLVVTLIRSCGGCRYCAQGKAVLCDSEHALDQVSPLKSASGEPVVQGLRTSAFAEYAVVDQSQVAVVPKDIPFASASLLGCGVITGLGAVVNTAKVPAGSRVAVIGTGGVGLNTIQGARLCGAETIVALDISDSKLEAAKKFGATHEINITKEKPRRVLRDLTGGHGVDYIFITVGNKAAIEQGISLLRRGGTAVIVGMTALGDKVAFEPLITADWCQKILGSKMGETKVKIDIPWLVSHYRKGTLLLDELVSNRYPIEQINDAIAEVERGQVLRNVIVF
jgi:Zn-dependent alcohol dehydrogenase